MIHTLSLQTLFRSRRSHDRGSRAGPRSAGARARSFRLRFRLRPSGSGFPTPAVRLRPSGFPTPAVRLRLARARSFRSGFPTPAFGSAPLRFRSRPASGRRFPVVRPRRSDAGGVEGRPRDRSGSGSGSGCGDVTASAERARARTRGSAETGLAYRDFKLEKWLGAVGPKSPPRAAKSAEIPTIRRGHVVR